MSLIERIHRRHNIVNRPRDIDINWYLGQTVKAQLMSSFRYLPRRKRGKYVERMATDENV